MKQTLRVLFIHASTLSNITEIERLEVGSAENPVKIKTDFLQTNGNRLDAVSEHVLAENYDAVVVDQTHTFDDQDKAYEQLGISQQENAYMVSGAALVEHLRSAFREAQIPEPKFGYIDIHKNYVFTKIFRELGIDDNSDFHLSTGFEGTETHIQRIYDACSADLD
jgi:hypothetical protein